MATNSSTSEYAARLAYKDLPPEVFHATGARLPSRRRVVERPRLLRPYYAFPASRRHVFAGRVPTSKAPRRVAGRR